MPIKNIIADGEGSSTTAGVTAKRALKVQQVPESAQGIPPEDLTNLRQLRKYLTNSAGSSDLNVNGATTPAEFYISADAGITQWITGFRVLMEDENMDINTNDFRRFGSVVSGPLTNGIQIEVLQSGVITSITALPIRYLGDFLNYTDGYTCLPSSVGPSIDFILFPFVFDKPVVLAEGSTDRLTVRIRDNLTAVNSFKVIARGYQEFA
jgi:hypothetical protein